MYKKFFGLSEAPFSISPNPKFFYLSSHHREALSMLRHGVTESGGFVLFTGEVGTGKTVILRTLARELRGDSRVDAAVISNPALSLIELLETVCREFGIPFAEGSSKRVLLENISGFLTERGKNGRRALLIIDEAQHLGDDAVEQVRLLTNIETDDAKLLQVILAGQPELQDKFRQTHMRQIAQRITTRFHLLPLSADETDSYIRFRMQAAGCVDIVFSRGAVRELYRFSRGIPRIINVCCDRALLAAYADGSRTVERKHMLRAVREITGERGPLGSLAEYLNSSGPAGAAAKIGAGLALAGLLGCGLWLAAFRPDGAEFDAAVAARLRADPEIAALEKTLADLRAREAGSADARRERSRYTADVLNSSFEEDAWKSLAREWGFADADGDFAADCRRFAARGYRCFAGSGSLAEIEKYNLPAVVSLLDGRLRPFYAVLLRLNDRYATLLINNREWTVRREFVASALEGGYRLVWPLPAGEETVTARSGSDAQLLLFEMLNRYENTDAYAFGGYDKTMTARVRKFQENAGLAADGVAGLDTLWALLPWAETEHPLYERYIAADDYGPDEAGEDPGGDAGTSGGADGS